MCAALPHAPAPSPQTAGRWACFAAIGTTKGRLRRCFTRRRRPCASQPSPSCSRPRCPPPATSARRRGFGRSWEHAFFCFSVRWQSCHVLFLLCRADLLRSVTVRWPRLYSPVPQAQNSASHAQQPRAAGAVRAAAFRSAAEVRGGCRAWCMGCCIERGIILQHKLRRGWARRCCVPAVSPFILALQRRLSWACIGVGQVSFRLQLLRVGGANM